MFLYTVISLRVRISSTKRNSALTNKIRSQKYRDDIASNPECYMFKAVEADRSRERRRRYGTDEIARN